MTIAHLNHLAFAHVHVATSLIGQFDLLLVGLIGLAILYAFFSD